MSTCARQCWIFAAVMGLVVFALSSLSGGIGPLPGLFLGLITAGLLGGLLVILFCQGAEDAEEWSQPVDNAKDPDEPASRSIRQDDGAVAQVPVARPLRPNGMEGAPRGASSDPAQAATFGDEGKAKGGSRQRSDTQTVQTDQNSLAPQGGPGADPVAGATTDVSRVTRQRRGKNKPPVLAETPETAHSGSVGRNEST